MLEIPGFKWDEERKRYFKVLKTGQLPESQYTISAIASDARKSNRRELKQRQKLFKSPKPHSSAMHVAKLISKRAKTIYNGQPEEIISCFRYLPQRNELVTGSRNGILSIGGTRSPPGLSTVCMCEVNNDVAVGAVNLNKSVIAVSGERLELANQFVTAISTLEGAGNLLIGSQKGCTLWNYSLGTKQKLYKVPSVSAISIEKELFIGSKDGNLGILDLRQDPSQPTTNVKLPNAVTNIGQHQSLVTATFLKDTMLLFDVRKFSEPVLQYPEYENWSTLKHGFALQSGTVCVAMEDGTCKCYEAKSGSILSSFGSKSRFVVPQMQWHETDLLAAHANKVKILPASSRLTLLRSADQRASQLHEALNR